MVLLCGVVGFRTASAQPVAFTDDQYRMAEKITNVDWGRDHYLENLSGRETSCRMIGTRNWAFSRAEEAAGNDGMRVVGTYGYAVNDRGTSEALREILENMKAINFVKKIGCSLIADCRHGGSMYVVASCLYEEMY